MRQYIGARYVPKFEGDWANDRTYEALCVVNYNGDSYTSKKPVPVGIAPTNTNYWALTGAYNSQLASYKAEMDAINDRSNFWHGKKVCVFGDSLSTDFGGRTSYWTYMNQLDPSIDITNRAEGGTTIDDLVNKPITIYTDLADFDIVVLAYGTNSWQSNENPLTMLDYYDRAIAYINTNAPKAQVVAITPYYSYSPYYPAGPNNTNNKLSEYCNFIKSYCGSKGVACIDFYTTSGVNEYNYQTMLLDDNPNHIYVHPSDDLAQRLAVITLFTPFQSDTGVTHTPFWEVDGVKGFILFKDKTTYRLVSVGNPSLTWADTVFQLPAYVKPAYTTSGLAVKEGDLGVCVLKNDCTLDFGWFTNDPSRTEVTFIDLTWYNLDIR